MLKAWRAESCAEDGVEPDIEEVEAVAIVRLLMMKLKLKEREGKVGRVPPPFVLVCRLDERASKRWPERSSLCRSRGADVIRLDWDDFSTL